MLMNLAKAPPMAVQLRLAVGAGIQLGKGDVAYLRSAPPQAKVAVSVGPEFPDAI